MCQHFSRKLLEMGYVGCMLQVMLKFQGHEDLNLLVLFVGYGLQTTKVKLVRQPEQRGQEH